MDYYVLTRKGAQGTARAGLATFFSGRDQDERTVPVFTTSHQAQRFAAGWSDTDEVRRLNEIDLLDWLITAYRQGVQRVTVDPERQSSRSRATSSLCLMLADLAENLNERWTASTSESRPDRLVTYGCRSCGKVRRQFTSQRTPSCCGMPMAAGAGSNSGVRTPASPADSRRR